MSRYPTPWQRKTMWAALSAFFTVFLVAIAGSVKLIISANERLLPHPIDLPRYQPFAYLPMFIMIGWILIDRFVKSALCEEMRANCGVADVRIVLLLVPLGPPWVASA